VQHYLSLDLLVGVSGGSTGLSFSGIADIERGPGRGISDRRRGGGRAEARRGLPDRWGSRRSRRGSPEHRWQASRRLPVM